MLVSAKNRGFLEFYAAEDPANFPNDFDYSPGGTLMHRPMYGGATCESCQSIDVRRWQREGRLRSGQYFPCSWMCGGEPFGSINVRTELDTVVLMFKSQSSQDGEWKSVEQRVPITWTPCHLGGRRAWFRCNVCSDDRYCGRRVALLYCAGELFACRHCCGLAYASQQESLRHRGLERARKIRARLGGSANMFDAFPERPKGMHRRTYARLRDSHDVAARRCGAGS
jgi:hypothetical protein